MSTSQVPKFLSALLFLRKTVCFDRTQQFEDVFKLQSYNVDATLVHLLIEDVFKLQSYNVNATLVHLLIAHHLMFPNIPTGHFYYSPRPAWFLVIVINLSDCEARSMVHHLSSCCSSIILEPIVYTVLNCNKVRIINSMNALFLQTWNWACLDLLSLKIIWLIANTRVAANF